MRAGLLGAAGIIGRDIASLGNAGPHPSESLTEERTVNP